VCGYTHIAYTLRIDNLLNQISLPLLSQIPFGDLAMKTINQILVRLSPSVATAIGATGLASALLFTSVAWTQPAGGGTGDGVRGGPPQEALDACKSLTSGKECTFNGRNGEVKGTCVAPEGKALACRPKDAPAKDGKTPPAKQ
jgi:hypothetical protein